MSTTKHSVRFVESSNQTVLFNSQSSSQEDLWYNRHDFRDWKLSTRKHAKAWRRQGYGVLLDNVFHVQSSAPDAQQRMDAIAQLDDSHCFRGMERHMNKSHDEDRTTTMQMAIVDFLDYQKQLKKQDVYTPEELVRELSSFLCDYSRTARQFARRTGKADELFVREGSFPDKARQICRDMSPKISNAPQNLTRWNSCGSGSSLSVAATSQRPRLPRRSSDDSIPEMEGDLSCSCSSTGSLAAAPEKKVNPGSPSSGIEEVLHTRYQLRQGGAPLILPTFPDSISNIIKPTTMEGNGALPIQLYY